MAYSDTIVIFGGGNVAQQLAKRLLSVDYPYRIQLFARNTTKLSEFAAQYPKIHFLDSLEAVDKRAALYLVAIKDDAIAAFAEQLSAVLPQNSFIVHTSGSVASTVFEPYFLVYGVLYPLQSISKQTQLDWHNVPLCLHLNQEEAISEKENLLEVATALSSPIFWVNDAQRATLHLAAVFANNFANHLFGVAETICRQQNLPFDILRPLIAETARKVQTASPATVQTGPAMRNDTETIHRHLAQLAQNADPLLSELYQLLSKHIQQKKA